MVRLLRLLSLLLLFLVYLLVFAGGMVKSTESGLSVPDWPTTYGQFMFSYPLKDMVGGIFYEHSHRMIASVVGMLTFLLTILVWRFEQRSWIKKLALAASLAVLVQGILGGITVLLYLPAAVSVLHGMLAQTFLILVMMLVFALHHSETAACPRSADDAHLGKVLRSYLFLALCIYFQLMLGAIMRHTEAGLAVPDFPTMAGQYLPIVDDAFMKEISLMRFKLMLPEVTAAQVIIHLAHRFFAFLIFVVSIRVFWQFTVSVRGKTGEPRFLAAIILAMTLLQGSLGILTVLTHKEPVTTSLHVLGGAVLLSLVVLIILRVSPQKWMEFRKILAK